eukprot:3653715-Pleurochrysis_carterae.AAC.4
MRRFEELSWLKAPLPTTRQRKRAAVRMLEASSSMHAAAAASDVCALRRRQQTSGAKGSNAGSEPSVVQVRSEFTLLSCSSLAQTASDTVFWHRRLRNLCCAWDRRHPCSSSCLRPSSLLCRSRHLRLYLLDDDF